MKTLKGVDEWHLPIKGENKALPSCKDSKLCAKRKLYPTRKHNYKKQPKEGMLQEDI
jgi:hypothetical protein